MNQTHVYVGCAKAGTVETFAFDPATGTLSPAGEPVGVEGVRSLASSRERGLLYAGASSKPPMLNVLDIDGSTGRLSNAARVQLADNTAYISLDADGQTVRSASYHHDAVNSVPLDADGLPAGNALRAPSPGEKAHSVRTSPDGRYVYAASLGSDRVVWYSTQTGELTLAGSLDAPTGSGPRHLLFNSDASRVYVIHEMSGEVAAHERDPDTGALTEIQRIDTVPASLGLVPGFARHPGGPVPGPDAIWCADIRIGGRGKFLFTTERSTSTVSTFAIDPDTGKLDYLRTTDTEEQPRGACVDADGEYLFVCGERSGHLSAYSISPHDGTLTATGRAATGEGPLWIEVVAPL
ncbi:lactonase family protein [Arthrobacter rhombi]|uniref:lactonase family protein n=1 Tax=Arthrobacter rhombi TaxID=71253 RepID=UPI003FD1A5E2